MVTIGAQSMTVADAITMKKLIEYKKLIITNLRTKYQQQQAVFNRNNEVVRENALKLATSYYSSGNAGVIPNLEASKQARKSIEQDTDGVQNNYINNHEFQWLDPLEIQTKLKEMESEVATFEADVDAVLSTSNAITVITV
jgi:hypothetical protein